MPGTDLRHRVAQLYFDLLYNPVYDLTTARLAPYQRLQATCIDRLEFAHHDCVLCVGVGTGNEIRGILSRNGQVDIVGVDLSPAALRRAGNKAIQYGKAVELHLMDAQELAFPDKTFDKALCLHLMGFLPDDRRATAEIVRVLKDGAQFVITYPSGNSLLRIGAEAGRSVGLQLKAGRGAKALEQLVALVAAGLINIPVGLWVKPRQGFYSRPQLEGMFASFPLSQLRIEEDGVYQEFIVSGIK
ncbi:MAG: class I SAM-dependent methyltransferase [Chloroflexota bacterium]|nr:class I SAM-dependent methyltransferase [Chloroflexota bacterium]